MWSGLWGSISLYTASQWELQSQTTIFTCCWSQTHWDCQKDEQVLKMGYKDGAKIQREFWCRVLSEIEVVLEFLWFSDNLCDVNWQCGFQLAKCILSLSLWFYFAEEAAEDSLAINIAQMEKRLLHGLIHNVLPHVGSSVKTLVLAYSSAASSKMVCNLKWALNNCGCAAYN